MILIVWPDGAMEPVHEKLVAQALTDGACLATEDEEDNYDAWLIMQDNYI